jgi:hypothetical protein
VVKEFGMMKVSILQVIAQGSSQKKFFLLFLSFETFFFGFGFGLD